MDCHLIIDGIDEQTDVSAEKRELDVHVDEAPAVDDPEDGEQDQSSGNEPDENETPGVADRHGCGLGGRRHRWNRSRGWCCQWWVYKGIKFSFYATALLCLMSVWILAYFCPKEA